MKALPVHLCVVASENLVFQAADVGSLDLSKAYDMTKRLFLHIDDPQEMEYPKCIFNYVANFLSNHSFQVLNAGGSTSPRLLQYGMHSARICHRSHAVSHSDELNL